MLCACKAMRGSYSARPRKLAIFGEELIPNREELIPTPTRLQHRLAGLRLPGLISPCMVTSGRPERRGSGPSRLEERSDRGNPRSAGRGRFRRRVAHVHLGAGCTGGARTEGVLKGLLIIGKPTVRRRDVEWTYNRDDPFPFSSILGRLRIPALRSPPPEKPRSRMNSQSSTAFAMRGGSTTWNAGSERAILSSLCRKQIPAGGA